MSLPIVYHKDIIEFITVAKEYIALLDFPEETNKRTVIFNAHKILPLLYLKASLLPDIPETFNEGNERFCSEELYDTVQNKIHLLLKSNDYDVLINYDSQNLDEQEWIKLSEIFADIFQSLYDFLNLYRIGNEEMMSDALYECQNDFKMLWGKKSLQLIESLHRMLFENLITENDDEPENKKTPLHTENWFTEKLKDIHQDHDHHHE
ncbi:MAG: DUF5063 domain-containing protein [Bacteroidales bacterium]|nr:DUF5063 domain-containing protein [Bacteroidales bacterium]